MTGVSTIFGAIPLVFASGAGAESRLTIGVVILGGLLFATVLTLFIIPVLYVWLAPHAKAADAVKRQLEQEMKGTRRPMEYELVRSRRRSLEVRVFPDGRVQVRAPSVWLCVMCGRSSMSAVAGSRSSNGTWRSGPDNVGAMATAARIWVNP